MTTGSRLSEVSASSFLLAFGVGRRQFADFVYILLGAGYVGYFSGVFDPDGPA